MIPIFFHLESHLWIAWLFVANGLMVTWLLRSWFESFRAFTQSFESQVLSAFFISVSINGLMVFFLAMFSFELSRALWPLILLGAILLLYTGLHFQKLRAIEVFRFEVGFLRLCLYGFVFIVLFYNGAMIEVVSDAWWHMSLSNKISLESTYNPALGHLVGMPARYYPPLWHGNLALANHLSEVSIAVYWNSLTAWVGAFKVMAFYLFALGMSKHRQVALVAALLFVLLPGLGVSYMRVSAWPSHISYTAWFVMFYVTSLLFDDLPNEDAGVLPDVLSFISAAGSKLIVVCGLCLFIIFTHKVEILWFSIAWLGYLIAASLSRLLTFRHQYVIVRDHYFLTFIYRATLLFLCLYSLWYARSQNYSSPLLNDQLIAYLLPSILAFLLIILDIRAYKVISFGVLFVFLLLAIGSVNFTHFYSFFSPELALPKGKFYESANVAIGYLGGELKVPGWHLQLRSGLLLSGALSVPIGLFTLFLKPTKLTIFLAGTGCLASFICLSPYLYHWFLNILNYHSPWRLALIIFHPIAWAFVIVTLIEMLKPEKLKA